MIDWQYPAIEAVKTVIKAVATIDKVGEYPDDLSLSGGVTVVALVSDKDENYELHTGNQMTGYMDISVKIYVPKKKGFGLSKSILIQNDVVNAVLASLTLSGTVTSISLTSISKGDISTDPNNAGYSEQVYVRDILFSVQKIVSRS